MWGKLGQPGNLTPWATVSREKGKWNIVSGLWDSKQRGIPGELARSGRIR